MVNPAVYLGGGGDFGTLDPGGLSAHIITRNLTPDKTGTPEGGVTFEEFVQIMRHGTDFDHWHPTCTGARLAPIELSRRPSTARFSRSCLADFMPI